MRFTPYTQQLLDTEETHQKMEHTPVAMRTISYPTVCNYLKDGSSDMGIMDCFQEEAAESSLTEVPPSYELFLSNTDVAVTARTSKTWSCLGELSQDKIIVLHQHRALKKYFNMGVLYLSSSRTCDKSGQIYILCLQECFSSCYWHSKVNSS